MRDQLLQGFSLGPLHVDPLSGRVSGADTDAHLPSRAVEILLVLAHHSGELVEREELLRQVWGDGQGSAEALSHAISELRHGLGDHADSPQFVQTVRSRGYRLIPELRLDADSTEQEPVDHDETSWPFLQELMKRGVVQAGVAHLVIGWILIQVAGETFSNLGLPPWAAPFVTYVVIAGFPIVLVLAWFLEFARGRMTIDRGESRDRQRGGLGSNYQAIIAAYVLATLSVGTYHASVGIRVPMPVGTPDAGALQAALPVEPDSIAVLRFLNITGSADGRIFSDGLAEDVLDRLARVPGLAVSSRGDAWSLPDNASSDDVRRRLRVAYYLEGSVRLVDTMLRVVVQLIDTETGFHVVSRRFDRKLENFMEVQKEVTDLTVGNLRVALPTDAGSMLAAIDTSSDPDVYVLYRLGREEFERPVTIETMTQATDYFKQAIALDPGYAAAHAGLCRAYVASFSVSGSPDYIELAERSCAEALATNPNLHMVYTALGQLYQETSRVSQAEDAYNSALQRNGKDVLAIQGLARVYERQHRLEEAEAELKRAIRLQPGNWRSINSLGTFYFAIGQYESAAEEFEKVVFLDPENWQILGNLGGALAMAGNFDDAATALERSIEISPQQTTYSNLGTIYYYLGEFDQAVKIHRLARDADPNSNIVWLNLADALHFAGDSELSHAAFEKVIELSTRRLSVDANDIESLQALAWANVMLGNRERGQELVGRAISLSPNDPYVYYYDALIRSRLGDIPGAIDAAERAIEAGYPKAMLVSEPYLAPLHRQERFVALTASANDR